MPVDFKPKTTTIDFKPKVEEPSKGHWEKKGLVTQWVADKPVDLSQRKDRRFFDTDNLKEGMTNLASKAPFFREAAGFYGDLGVQLIEGMNEPEAVAGGFAKGILPRIRNFTKRTPPPPPAPPVSLQTQTQVPPSNRSTPTITLPSETAPTFQASTPLPSATFKVSAPVTKIEGGWANKEGKRLQELFDKKNAGTITPEELAEASRISKLVTPADRKKIIASAPPKKSNVTVDTNTGEEIPVPSKNDPNFIRKEGDSELAGASIKPDNDRWNSPEGKRLQELTAKDIAGKLTAEDLIEGQKLNKLVRGVDPLPSQIAKKDPNFNSGAGNPELAGTVPYPKVEIPVVNKVHGPEDYEMDNAFIKARGGEVSPQMDDLAKGKTPETAILPSFLKGAKPRFNMGSKSFEPEFDNDIDKALYIIAQGKPSKADSSYLDFLKKHTGLDEDAIRLMGKDVKDKLKIYLQGQEKDGLIKIPRLSKFNVTSEVTKRTEAPRIRTTDPTEGRNILRDLGKSETGQLTVNLPQMPKITNPAGQLGDAIRVGLREARQLQTTMDLSMPLRQGISMWTRPEYWKSFAPMFKSAATEKGFNTHLRKLEADPDYALLKRAGVEFTNLKDVLEESATGKYIQRIPGIGRIIKGSNQGYTAFGNELRLGAGKRMLADARRSGVKFVSGTPEADPTARAIASFINDATGRGGLGRFEKSARELNDFVFAPKLIASRVNMFRRAFDSLTMGKITPEMIGKNVDTRVAKQLRQEAIRSMLGVGSLAATSSGLSMLSGAKGTDDPRSTDFGKFKIGNTRVDFTGGNQQYVRVAAQVATGKINREGKVEDKNSWETLGRWGTNKLAPAASLIVDYLSGTDAIGEKFTWTEALKSRTVPLIIQDIEEIAKSDPESLPWVVPAVFFGAGAQSYKTKGKGTSSGGLFPKIALPPSMPKINLN